VREQTPARSSDRQRHDEDRLIGAALHGAGTLQLQVPLTHDEPGPQSLCSLHGDPLWFA
jgi:hypothetical protein